MVETLHKLKKVMDVGYVGGSDYTKIKSQLNEESIALPDFFFS